MLKDTQHFITIAEAAKGTSYSPGYLSLRARQGKLLARKIGRNWYTTHAAVEQYANQQQEFFVRQAERKNGGLEKTAPRAEIIKKSISSVERISLASNASKKTDVSVREVLPTKSQEIKKTWSAQDPEALPKSVPASFFKNYGARAFIVRTFKTYARALSLVVQQGLVLGAITFLFFSVGIVARNFLSPTEGGLFAGLQSGHIAVPLSHTSDEDFLRGGNQFLPSSSLASRVRESLMRSRQDFKRVAKATVESRAYAAVAEGALTQARVLIESGKKIASDIFARARPSG